MLRTPLSLHKQRIVALWFDSVLAVFIAVAVHRLHRSPEPSLNSQNMLMLHSAFLLSSLLRLQSTLPEFLLRVSILLHTLLPHRVDQTVVNGQANHQCEVGLVVIIHIHLQECCNHPF